MKISFFSSIKFRLILAMMLPTFFILLIFSITLGKRVSKLNSTQFAANINTTVELTDSALINHFEGLASSANMFANFDLIMKDDQSITSYVNLSDPSGKIPMDPANFSPYELEVYNISKVITEAKEEILGISTALESNGAFVRFPPEPRANGYDSRGRSWYKNAIKDKGEVHFSDAYMASAGYSAIVISRIIFDKSRNIRGVVSIDANLDFLGKLIQNAATEGQMDIILCDNKGTILVDTSNSDNFFKKINEIGIKEMENIELKGLTDGSTPSVLGTNINGKPYELRLIPSNNGMVGLNYIFVIPETTLQSYNIIIRKMLVLIMIFSLIVLAIISAINSRSISKKIINVAVLMENISEGDGDLTQRLPVKSKDEIGNLCEFFNKTLEKISASLKSVKSESSTMKELGGQLTTNMNETADSIRLISTNVSNVKNQVINQSAGVEETAKTIQQISDNINKLTENISTQSKDVSVSSAAIEQMVANIRSVSQNLEKNDQAVKELTDSAALGQSIVSETVSLTENINLYSDGLIEASNVIQNIAEQTNLLAMNAAIEAAHAGETGKGFAVVSDEIRKLAEDSNEQGKKISEVLNSLKGMIINVTDSIKKIEKQFDTIYQNTKAVSEQEFMIKNAMDEQTAGSQQILDSMHEINSITVEVNEGAQIMEQGGKEILIEMDKLASVTNEINESMNEISNSVTEINTSVQNINSMTSENEESIVHVNDAINKFKL